MMDYVLFVTVTVSVITDIWKRRIFNFVTFPAILIGLTYHPATSGWNGFLFSFSGSLIGGGLLIIPYLLGGMGAGDVKLMAAIGALLGPKFVLNTTVFTAFIGGLLAIAVLLPQVYRLGAFYFRLLVLHSPSTSSENAMQLNLKKTFPYGVAIGLGTLAAIVQARIW